MFGITTLCTGYGIAGLSRRFLVWPAAMIWPSSLVNAAMFYTLHDHSRSDPSRTNGWSIGRYRWFMIVFSGAFLWYWFPGWIFNGLTWFCWLTWIWPDSVIVNKLFGGMSGYGLMPITFVSLAPVDNMSFAKLADLLLISSRRIGPSSQATSSLL